MNTIIERNPSGQKNLDLAHEYTYRSGDTGLGTLSARYLIDKQNRLNGFFERYNETGQTIERGTYQNNKKEGVWTTYYSNGNIEEECFYQNGKRHGLCKRYFSTGKLAEEVTYQNGEIYGPYKRFNLKNKLICNGFRKNNGKYGIWTWYNENGEIIKKSYYNKLSLETILYLPQNSEEDKTIQHSITVRRDTLKHLQIIAQLAQTVTPHTIRIIRKNIINEYHENTAGLTVADLWRIRNGARSYAA